jgi:hypothetical protein
MCEERGELGDGGGDGGAHLGEVRRRRREAAAAARAVAIRLELRGDVAEGEGGADGAA